MEAIDAFILFKRVEDINDYPKQEQEEIKQLLRDYPYNDLNTALEEIRIKNSKEPDDEIVLLVEQTFRVALLENSIVSENKV